MYNFFLLISRFLYKRYMVLVETSSPDFLKIEFVRLIFLYSKGFDPGSDSRSCSVIFRVRVVLKRTVVGDSD